MNQEKAWKIICNLKYHVISAELTVSEVLMAESYPEDDKDPGSSYPSSESADFDSVGQEIANSMMTLLLPRALPLLNTFSRRKKNKLKHLEKSELMSMNENKNTPAVLSPGNLLTCKP